MKELEIKNLKYEVIEQIKQEGRLFNRVFISFDLINTTKKAYEDIRIKIFYKTSSQEQKCDLVINHINPEEEFTYGYELYLTKEIIELSSNIAYKESESNENKKIEVLKFNKDNELLFKIKNDTGKDINYARVYIEFIKDKKAFTGTNILLSAVKKNEEREVEFILPKSFKCDSYVLKVDYCDDKIMSVYEFGKKYIDVMKEYMEATDIEDKVADIGNETASINDDLDYYNNYKKTSFGRALWEAVKDTFSDLFLYISSAFVYILGMFIPIIIVIIVLELLKIPVLYYAVLLIIIGVPAFLVISIIVKTIKTMANNLSQKEVKKEIDELYEQVDNLQKKLGNTDKKFKKAISNLEDLLLKNPQYQTPPLDTVSRLFFESLMKAIDETDISWEEVMRIAIEDYYITYEETQKEVERIKDEMAEAELQEEERNRQMQRDFEEQQFREKMLTEQRVANYARQSEMERQTKAMEKANDESWERAQKESDLLNAIYRNNYYNNY